MGWRVYATNQLQLNLAAVVWGYRGQNRLEDNWSRLKGQPLGLTPMYLQYESRIHGPGAAAEPGVATAEVVEWAVRKKLQESGQTLKGLYAGQPGRQAKRPSAELLLRRSRESAWRSSRWRGSDLSTSSPLDRTATEAIGSLGIATGPLSPPHPSFPGTPSDLSRTAGNPVLERKIAPLLKRPVGRPSHKPKVFYAASAIRPGRGSAPAGWWSKVEWHAGELFPRVGFIVTNLKWHSKKVVRFYNRRGTAEQWIKEGKNAVKWTKLSCRRFKDNAARLQLFALAYNLANFLRQLVLPKPIKGWTLTTLREKLIKIGAKVVSPRQVRHLPAGGGGGAPPAVRGDSGADRPAAAGVCLGVRFAATGQSGLNVVAVRPRCAARADFGG